MRYRTYTLRIETHMPDKDEAGQNEQPEQDALSDALTAAEDIVNVVLPDGYYCKIDEAD